MKYSLADYYLTINVTTDRNRSIRQLFGQNGLTIGGTTDNALDNISISYKDDLWSTETFPTGAWVHNKNLSRAGTITIRLSQLSTIINKFKNYVNLCLTDDEASCTVTLMKSGEDKAFLTAKDCYFTQIPQQQYGRTAGTEDWVLTSGEISYT